MIVYVFLFVIGLCVGSFLNVVIYRLNHNLSPFKGRSICPKCKHLIEWKDNLPLLSFFLLKGKCRWCRFPISWQYPLVELATGILTMITFYLTVKQTIVLPVFNLLVAWILIVIFVSDLRYGTIPDGVVFFSLILNLIFISVNLRDVHLLATHLLWGILAAGFFLFLVLTTRGRGMGLGDVKLVLLMGVLLGWPRIALALILAFLTGAIAGVILILGGKKKPKDSLPFGPFLAGSTWVMVFWGLEFFRRYQEWLLR